MRHTMAMQRGMQPIISNCPSVDLATVTEGGAGGGRVGDLAARSFQAVAKGGGTPTNLARVESGPHAVDAGHAVNGIQ